MRIHTDLSAMHVINAVHALPGTTVAVAKIERHGSRKRANGIELQLFGSGRTGGQWGNHSGKAATWDEWGMVIARIYAADSRAIVGPYPTADAFRWSTSNRFGGWGSYRPYEDDETAKFVPSDLTPETQHLQHKWAHDGVSLGGSYATSHCTKCDARTRRLIRSTWEEFNK